MALLYGDLFGGKLSTRGLLGLTPYDAGDDVTRYHHVLAGGWDLHDVRSLDSSGRAVLEGTTIQVEWVRPLG
jgi:hypothetical protein